MKFNEGKPFSDSEPLMGVMGLYSGKVTAENSLITICVQGLI